MSEQSCIKEKAGASFGSLQQASSNGGYMRYFWVATDHCEHYLPQACSKTHAQRILERATRAQWGDAIGCLNNYLILNTRTALMPNHDTLQSMMNVNFDQNLS